MQHLVDIQRRVKLFKFFFLIVGVFIVVLIVTSIYFEKLSSVADNTDLQNIKVEHKLTDDCSLNIEGSVYEGINSELLPYKINVKNISKDRENNYSMESLSGKYTLEQGDVYINAVRGILNEDKKQLLLNDNVRLILNDFKITGKELYIDIETNDLKSAEPVTIYYNNSAVRANQMDTKNSARIIELKGKVESVFNLKDF